MPHSCFCEQDSARLCLFCESVLTLCVLQADPSLNPAAHLAGIVAEPASTAGRGTAAAADPALRLRLRRLLAACLDHTERELNKVRRFVHDKPRLSGKVCAVTVGGSSLFLDEFIAPVAGKATLLRSAALSFCASWEQESCEKGGTRQAFLPPCPLPVHPHPIQGVTEGNSPLKILLMLTGSRGHVACPSGMPEPAMTPPAVEARAAVSRCCLELLVRRKIVSWKGSLGGWVLCVPCLLPTFVPPKCFRTTPVPFLEKNLRRAARDGCGTEGHHSPEPMSSAPRT